MFKYENILIDSSDIKNLALAVNSVNRDVDTLKAGLEDLLPQGENSDVSNIVGLITSGTATQDDVLEGMTFFIISRY